MSNDTMQLLTPVGRLVQGGPFSYSDTNMDGKPLTDSKGAPRKDYFMALAIAKNSPEWDAFKAQIDAVASAAFPHHWSTPAFSNKITDGDGTIPDTRGVRPCDKEGFAGHWVVRFSSGFAPDVFTKGGTAKITDPDQVKRGHYVRIYGSVKGNGSTSKPGVYLNLSMVEHIAYGPEISNGPDAASVFGSAPAVALPDGASAIPLAPPTALAAPGAVAPPVAAAPPVAPPVATAPPVAATVEPAHDFLNVAPPVAGPHYVVPGSGSFTRAQLTASGWSDEQIQQLAEDEIPF